MIKFQKIFADTTDDLITHNIYDILEVGYEEGHKGEKPGTQGGATHGQLPSHVAVVKSVFLRDMEKLQGYCYVSFG